MNSLLIFALVIVAVAAFLSFLRRRQSSSVESFPYESCGVLFSPAERSFLGVLEQAVGRDFQIFGKVRLNDLICVRKGLPKSTWQAAYNRIDRKHIDFVVCRRSDLSLIAAIELDDRTHSRKDRVDRDDFLEKAFAAVGLPLLRFPAQKAYALEEVKKQLAIVLLPGENKEVMPNRTEAAQAKESVSVRMEDVKENSLPTISEEPPTVATICQKCGSEMVKRKAGKGIHAGKWFWACASFPKCRSVEPVTGE